MTINVRTKGQSGEREIATMLNRIVAEVREYSGLPKLDTRDELFQRNQNQSAVGGDDLTNPLRLSIEVKRQEQLSINSWWKQCSESAARQGNIPILLFRQNRKPWRCIMLIDVPISPPHSETHRYLHGVRGEIDIDRFQLWFHAYYGMLVTEGLA